MLRHKFKAAVVMTGLSVMMMSMPVSAAEQPVLVDKFEKDGVQISIWTAAGCELPELPGIILPGQPGTGTPDVPETEVPDVEQPDAPETEAPDVEQPNQPENGNPDNGKPETPDQGTDSENQSFAMQVVKLVNQERAKEGLPALTVDANIEKAALVRAMETEKSFSHTRPDGRTFSTALTEAGVTFRGAGENIAYGQKTPEQVMEGWMNSPGHRANIMNKNFTKIGVGYYQNSNGVKYWTQLFTY